MSDIITSRVIRRGDISSLTAEKIRSLPVKELFYIDELNFGPAGLICLDNATEGYGARASLALEQFAKLKPPYKLLDVGTGKGDVVECLRKYGIEAYGIDVVEIFPKREYFSRQDACNMEFPDGMFDAVFEYLLFNQIRRFEHDEESPKKILKEIRRVLKSNGFLVVGFDEDIGFEENGFKCITPVQYRNPPRDLVYQKIG
ncbi:MAG: class I SAM-dependent methyltransferase [Candidatus Aenigmarchaeota archaeon]|nr:class I SAM-dependent methyltransferase [Candidatus Aenigmarchaeota archaeon]